MQSLRRMSGPKREEVARGWRRLHNEELHNLYASPNINGVIKSRGVRWLECSIHWGNIKFWSENLKGRGHFEDLGVDRKIILE
jgi:hypothetical protein